ncbi:MAG: aminotransferase class III-fold pyridoxal phosphate-dependent enzyme, partial [Candidatus Aenigmarchaeota archaeon]|nr:aminotransferase class III-fold pyridoxal phosphate-dependent enzyme [Candidatus Aenigmarchaeota archaeon]
MKPDIIGISKQLGGGYPISATLFREDLMSPKFMRELHWQAFSASGTPMSCAVGSTVIDIILDEKVPEQAESKGKIMTEKLKKLQEKHPYIGDVRGPGLFIGVELVRNRTTKEKASQETTKVMRSSVENGVVFGQSLRDGLGNVVKIKPPVVISHEQIDQVVSVLDNAL